MRNEALLLTGQGKYREAGILRTRAFEEASATTGILDGHERSNDRALTAEICIKAGLVVEYSDPDNIIGNLRTCAGRSKGRGSKH